MRRRLVLVLLVAAVFGACERVIDLSRRDGADAHQSGSDGGTGDGGGGSDGPSDGGGAGSG